MVATRQKDPSMGDSPIPIAQRSTIATPDAQNPPSRKRMRLDASQNEEPIHLAKRQTVSASHFCLTQPTIPHLRSEEIHGQLLSTFSDTASEDSHNPTHAAASSPQEQPTAEPHRVQSSPSYQTPNPVEIQFRMQSLPVLDNLATQILTTISKYSQQQTMDMTNGSDSEAARDYRILHDLFIHAKKGYSTHEAFLNARDLGFTKPAHIETVRKANLATFMISILNGSALDFVQLDAAFLDAFIPEDQPFLPIHGDLFLQLKTHAFIASLSGRTQGAQVELDRIFPHAMAHQLLERGSVSRPLRPSEKAFLDQAEQRRNALLEECQGRTNTGSLLQQYSWDKFLYDVTMYVKLKIHLASASENPVGKNGASARVTIAPQKRFTHNNAADFQHPAPFAIENDGSDDDFTTFHPSHAMDSVDLATRTSLVLATDESGPELRFHFENELHPNVPGPEMSVLDPLSQNGPWAGPFLTPDHIPNPAQSAPTAALYDKARAAAAAKASPVPRKPTLPNQRRAWSQEEEKALMAGLDRVGGPHWSQILAIFGKGGTISEVLKDRGQVHLKDKARNLKLFFLKHDIEVPYYLQAVTGELKTRAPGIAARKEAQKKQLSEVDRAHIEGVMALASGPQQRTDAMSTGEPTAGTGSHGATGDSNLENVDPSLTPMPQQPHRRAAKTFTAEFIMPMGKAPNADMTSGRQTNEAAS